MGARHDANQLPIERTAGQREKIRDNCVAGALGIPQKAAQSLHRFQYKQGSRRYLPFVHVWLGRLPHEDEIRSLEGLDGWSLR